MVVRFFLGPVVMAAVAGGVWAVVAVLVDHSPQRVQAATLAALVCWGAALPGWALFVMKNDPDWGLMAAGTGMVLRLMVCLGAVLLFQVTRHPLQKAGVGEMLVVFYLALLVAETGLFVALSRYWPVQGARGQGSGVSNEAVPPSSD